MRIFYINASAAKRSSFTASRLRSAAATAFAVLLVLSFAVALRDREGDSVPASAVTAERTVYAISYCGADKETLEMMRRDMEYMRGLGLDFTLPDRLRELKNNGVILILESTADPEPVLSMLAEFSAPAVVIPQKGLDPAAGARLLDLEDEGRISLAAYVDSAEGPWELAASIGEASIDFSARFGRPCTVFVHECRGVVCSGCFGGAWEPARDLTVFVFGNGMNAIPRGEKPFVLNRIMRLADWTIESYFSEIAK